MSESEINQQTKQQTGPQTNQQLNTSRCRNGLWGIIVLIISFMIILLIFSIYVVKTIFSSGDENGVVTTSSFSRNSSNELIGIVEIKGVILDSQKIVESLIAAEKNKKVKAIIVRIESPGGGVAPTQEIYQEIMRIDKIKPVYASLSSIAASGGYYVATAARRIYANPGTLTGSIGVLMQFVDLSKLYSLVKVSPETIKAGSYKDIGSPSRPMNEKERALLQEVVKGIHHQFIRDVMKLRKNKIVGRIEDLAQGQIYSGETAHQLGLVDKEAGLWEAGREIHQELKLKGEMQFIYIKTSKKGFLLSNLFDTLEESASFIKQMMIFNNIPLLFYRP